MIFFKSFIKSPIRSRIGNRIRIRNSKFMKPEPGGKLIKDPPDQDPHHCNKGYNVLSTIYDVHHGYLYILVRVQ
jgi:hypothetical protein